MNILFVHQNFPGQYLHLARHLGATPGHQVVFITQRSDAALPGVRNLIYRPERVVTQGVHRYLRDVEAGVLNAQQVARVALKLKQSGFVPDVMLAHNGWGELWYLKDVFPNTPLVGYFEFFYRLHGADVGFAPDAQPTFDTGPRVRTKNLGNLLALDTVDLGQCPTHWQKSLYPQVYQPKLQVIHEGINTQLAVPHPAPRFQIPHTNRVFTQHDEVITYVARNLEPYRGFPGFMRSLVEILARRPAAQVLIVGGDATSYGPPPVNGKTFRAMLLQELGTSIDLQRVHFLGKVPYATFLQVLQVSSVHVYLTYPFVLSWSMLEAMSAGCLVIGSRTAPVEEVIRHGDNGLLVDFFSVREIANTVVQVLRHPHHYAQLRTNARRTIVERYDLITRCLPAQVAMLRQLGGN